MPRALLALIAVLALAGAALWFGAPTRAPHAPPAPIASNPAEPSAPATLATPAVRRNSRRFTYACSGVISDEGTLSQLFLVM